MIDLEPGERISIVPTRQKNSFGFPATPTLKIFRYKGRDKSLLAIFNTVNFHLDIDDDDFKQFGISSEPTQIIEDHHNERSLFSFNFLSRNKKRMIPFNPFNTSCIGIESSSDYKVHLQFIRIDFWRVALCTAGLAFIVLARKLSQNSLFFYFCGVMIGICASFLVLFYLMQKLIPKKSFLYGSTLFGCSLGIYFSQLIIENIQAILVTYQTAVFWYVVVTGVLSFIVCYRHGPPTNERSKNLILWSLQAIGFFCVFFSSDFQEATLVLNFLAFSYHFFPVSWILKVKSLWRRRFPPTVRLLTEEEFIQQGAVETQRALEELRNYCNSPDCKQWRLVRQLQDPDRFASFIEGNPHVTNQEMMLYESGIVDLSDDDSGSSASEISNAPARSSRQGTPLANNFQQFATSTPQMQQNPGPSQLRRTPARQTPSRSNVPVVQQRRATPVQINGRGRSRLNRDSDISDDD